VFVSRIATEASPSAEWRICKIPGRAYSETRVAVPRKHTGGWPRSRHPFQTMMRAPGPSHLGTGRPRTSIAGRSPRSSRIGPENVPRSEAVWRLRAFPEPATARTVLILPDARSQVHALHALSPECKRLHAQLCTQKRIENALIRSSTAFRSVILHYLSHV